MLKAIQGKDDACSAMLKALFVCILTISSYNKMFLMV